MDTGTTYVIFDGDKDKYAYAFMNCWKVNDRVEFDFRDAHDLGVMTARAQDEGLRQIRTKKENEGLRSSSRIGWRKYKTS